VGEALKKAAPPGSVNRARSGAFKTTDWGCSVHVVEDRASRALDVAGSARGGAASAGDAASVSAGVEACASGFADDEEQSGA